jgi:hypothetical protein
VVAKVEVPYIASVPDAERLPAGAAVKLRFSTQNEPLQ